MPNPGDQHTIVANPFQAKVPHIAEYTAQEIATLQSRLEKQLGPEYLSARSGPSGQRVHYITADKVIALANEVFGFNGWSSSIQTIQIDFVDENPQTLKISIGLSVIVRVTLRDGSFHEDIGYGHIENCKGKAAAFEKAKKEGTTDALKRALRNFGNVLGNCIYDKSYVQRVSKLKVVPNKKFDERGLYRHADYVVKQEPSAAVVLPKAAPATTTRSVFTMDPFEEDLLGDFDEADFCVPEESLLDESITADTSIPSLPPPVQQKPQSRSVSPVRSFQVPPGPMGNNGPLHPPQTPTPNNTRPNGPAGGRPYQPAHPANHQAGRPQAGHAGPKPNANTNNPTKEEEGTPWLSARAVAKVGDGDPLAAVASSVQAGHLFNPKAESPSIRKTPGIDHNTSKPVPRVSGRPGPLPGSTPSGVGPVHVAGNIAGPGPGRPMPEPVRRIGAPSHSHSPLANRGQFRPPPMKRGPPGEGTAGRPPLSEVPNNVPMNGPAEVDAKRPRLA